MEPTTTQETEFVWRRLADTLKLFGQELDGHFWLAVLIPVLIIAFGFDIWPKVIVVVLFCFFPITVATIDGLTATDPDLVSLLRAMGASRLQIWRIVRFPSALPSFFSGLRIAATYSVTGAIVGEYVTSNAGLGNYLRSAFSNYRSDQSTRG